MGWEGKESFKYIGYGSAYFYVLKLIYIFLLRCLTCWQYNALYFFHSNTTVFISIFLISSLLFLLKLTYFLPHIPIFLTFLNKWSIFVVFFKKDSSLWIPLSLLFWGLFLLIDLFSHLLMLFSFFFFFHWCWTFWILCHLLLGFYIQFNNDTLCSGTGYVESAWFFWSLLLNFVKVGSE